MNWVTRSHVHVDRVACPWLISRFIDQEAKFSFVPKSQIDQAVKETGAIPFDAPDVELGHKGGKCSFESIIDKYGLTDPALLRLAKIVHAADIKSDLDTDPIGWYCYTAIEFVGEHVLLAYCAGNKKNAGLNRTQISRLSVADLYD